MVVVLVVVLLVVVPVVVPLVVRVAWGVPVTPIPICVVVSPCALTGDRCAAPGLVCPWLLVGLVESIERTPKSLLGEVFVDCACPGVVGAPLLLVLLVGGVLAGLLDRLLPLLGPRPPVGIGERAVQR